MNFNKNNNNNNDKYIILVNNLKILYNQDKEHNTKCMIIYDYLKNLNIEYDDIFLLNKIKKYNFKLYKLYLNIINTIYENLFTNNLNSIFDDYEGNNIWNKNTYLYDKIYSLLLSYDEENNNLPNNLH